MLVLTEQTPNPDALKFIPELAPGARLTEGATYALARSGFDAARSTLAAALFGLAGVERVFVAPGFVTVTRAAAGPPWSALRYAVIAAIAEHLASGAPAIADDSPPVEDAGQDPIEEEIRQVLGLHVRPGVARDGGDVLFERFDADTGVLWIRMQGACGGCPSSRLTLKSGIEQIVRRYVPEVARVEEIGGAPAPAGASRLRRWIEGFGGRGAGARPVFTHGGREIPRRPERTP
ncbi:NifU family protein [Phenylobacterium soli]|uniref:NifU family protein n=1 Tax=Phenylobacterium soli TaxID=2170551 RepID=A0A328AG40_9CAUL|nr:NifU family protein [Phenylobacterium soli]